MTEGILKDKELTDIALKYIRATRSLHKAHAKLCEDLIMMVNLASAMNLTVVNSEMIIQIISESIKEFRNIFEENDVPRKI